MIVLYCKTHAQKNKICSVIYNYVHVGSPVVSSQIEPKDTTPGYTGTYCSEEIDDCVGVACNNSNTQYNIDQLESYKCSCLPGFTGANCQNDLNECITGPERCNFHGVLLDCSTVSVRESTVLFRCNIVSCESNITLEKVSNNEHIFILKHSTVNYIVIITSTRIYEIMIQCWYET